MHLYALVGLLASMVIAYVMDYFRIAWSVNDFAGAVELGFACWAGFVAPTMLGIVLWDQKPLRLYLINTLYWLVALVTIALVLVLGSQVGSASFALTPVSNGGQAIGLAQPALPQSTVALRGQTVRVSVADTPASRQRGLGGRSGLAPDEGMLFVFPQDGTYGFWMKDMSFSIDILWLSADGAVVYMAQNVSPDTYPQRFGPAEPARYVLELHAGFVIENNVTIGDIVRL